MADTKNINMWSGPRNVSTALMYSFAQRNNTKVVDEPFYAHYLLQTGLNHPGRQEVLESQENDPELVIDNLISLGKQNELLFLKNMAHHMISMGDSLNRLFSNFQHLFLIRNPREMLPSLQKTIPNPTLRDTAYKHQFELFSTAKTNELPFTVIDSTELLKDPKSKLEKLCNKLNISFNETMLSWNAGPIPEDGVWAKHWYHGVHNSTGFKPYKPKQETFPQELLPLYKKCKTYYSKMLAHAI